MRMATTRHRIGFVIEQSLGHVTHAQNLKAWVERDTNVEPSWVWVPYRASDFLQRVPGLPFSVKLSLRARRRIEETLACRPLDSLYLHTQGLTLFSLGLMKTVPTVISLDATPEGFKSIASAYGARPATGFVDRIKATWFRAIFARAVGLVAFSDWVKYSLVRHYGVPESKVRVIRSGVDVSQWTPSVREVSSNRPLRLLFVGGDFTRKGGHVLLRAFREGLADVCELDIVSRDLSIETGRSIRVHSGLSPNSMDLKRLYELADLFVLPTQGDATPFAILEAMASGLPVITTDVGALGELVQDGVTGYLIRADDPSALVERITQLTRDRSRLAELGKASRRRAEQAFNAEKNYKTLIAYLKEVGHPGSPAS